VSKGKEKLHPTLAQINLN